MNLKHRTVNRSYRKYIKKLEKCNHWDSYDLSVTMATFLHSHLVDYKKRSGPVSQDIQVIIDTFARLKNGKDYISSIPIEEARTQIEAGTFAEKNHEWLEENVNKGLRLFAEVFSELW